MKFRITGQYRIIISQAGNISAVTGSYLDYFVDADTLESASGQALQAALDGHKSDGDKVIEWSSPPEIVAFLTTDPGPPDDPPPPGETLRLPFME